MRTENGTIHAPTSMHARLPYVRRDAESDTIGTEQAGARPSSAAHAARLQPGVPVAAAREPLNNESYR